MASCLASSAAWISSGLDPVAGAGAGFTTAFCWTGAGLFWAAGEGEETGGAAGTAALFWA